MSSQSDFSAMNASAIVFSNMINKQKAWPEISENNGKAGAELSTDEKPPADQQTPGRQEYYTAQFPHPMFPSWPMHSPPGGMPTFQGYPMQGMPYYLNYPGGSPFFQQPYPSMEDPRFNVGQRIQKQHSMDSRDSRNGSDTWEMERAKSQDDEELEGETSLSPKSRKRISRSDKKQSGVVVIRNINYITSKRRNSLGSDSQSHSDPEKDEEDGDNEHKSPLRSSKGKGIGVKPDDGLNSLDKEETGQWRAFQNYLLRDAEEEERRTDRGMFSAEKEVGGRRRPNGVGEVPLVFGGREMGHFDEGNTTDMHKISAGGSHMLKASNDQSLISRRGGHSADGRLVIGGQMDLHSTEIDGRKVYRRSTNDDFIIDRQKSQSGFTSSLLDPLAPGLERRSSNNIDDDSYIVPFRSTSASQVGTNNHNAINMDSEFSLSLQKADSVSNRVGSQVNYELDDLSLMPVRGTEVGSIGFDPALDYEMQVHAKDGSSLDKKNKERMRGSKKSDKDRKSKLISDSSDKKKGVGPIRKGKPSKLSPLDEAKARAERLRTYKADLQKMKKEKEEAEIRRLEALRMERQKRIATRGSSVTGQSSLGTQSKRQLPSKLSPSSHKGSKFTDAEPGSSSPLQRSIRTASVGSAASNKASKPSKLNTGTHFSGNRSRRSVSSLGTQSKRQLPSKLSPSSHKGSKFTDAEPGSSSPLQRSIRTASVGSAASNKASKPSKLNTGTHFSGNRSRRSVSSLGTQSKRQLPSKLSPSSHKGSKFTDAEPGSSSPLQRSIRTASVGSAASNKASKPSKLNTGTHFSGNRSRRSVSSLPEPRKDIGGVTPDTKASMARIRRLSEPKTSSSPHVSSVKSRKSEPSSRTKVSGGPKSKKISAIMNRDKSKIASLPELKITTTKAPDVTYSKSGRNGMTQKVNGSISSTTNVTEPDRNEDKVSLHFDGDDHTVIEKKVVMLEREKPSIPTVNSLEGNLALQEENDGIFKIGRKIEVVSDYASIRAPVSSLNVDAVDKEHRIQQIPKAYQVRKGNVINTKKESSKFTSSSVTEKTYQAPFAMFSLEDPCSKISEYSRAPPTSTLAAAIESESVRALVASKNLKLEKIPEVLDKPPVKESSKGIRRLLKFGRKNHSSTSQHSIESDSASVNGSAADKLATNTASSSEVHMLKNLISQDETPTAGNMQKSSRPFSLLSPFRSKVSEKKLTAL
ncbi:hypothetical protein DITRI_Ditri15bG0100900 [Diplodiscus trichospermus]